MKNLIILAEQLLPLAEEVLALKHELDAFKAEYEKPYCTQSDLEDWTDAAQEALEYSWEKRDREESYMEKKKELKEFLVTSFDGAMSVYNYGIKLWDTYPAPSNEIDKNGNELAPFYKAGALYQASYNPYVDEWVDVQLLAYIDKSEELRRLDEILYEVFLED